MYLRCYLDVNMLDEQLDKRYFISLLSFIETVYIVGGNEGIYYREMTREQDK